MDSKTKAARAAFCQEHEHRCFSCGGAGSDVHEMARGCHRSVAVRERCCWLLLCRPCHEEMDDYSIWPLTRQLALKLISDPIYFSPERFNEIRGRAPGAITLSEVVVHLQMDYL